jgi:UDP:flavonoid glycosyltransferase YjiC (YdhE family)
VSLPRRFHTPRGLRLAVRRLLDDRRYAEAAEGLRKWSERHDGAALAADALEELTPATV